MPVIDIHTHGIGGYDSRSGDPEHLLRIAEIHGSHGVDEIILAIYPATIPVMRQALTTVKRAMEMQGQGHVTMRDEYSTGKYGIQRDSRARITGVHLEGPFINPSRCGSLNAMVFLEPSEARFNQLTDGFEDIVRIVTISPELTGSPALIRRMADRGITVSMGHSDATYAEAEAGYRAGAKGITHIFNAMRPFHHREPGIAGFGLTHPDVYIEVIGDPYHLHQASVDLIFRVKPLGRIIIISDSVREAKVPGRLSDLGLTDDHDRLLGGSMTVTEAVKSLSEELGNTDILECISTNPERYLS